MTDSIKRTSLLFTLPSFTLFLCATCFSYQALAQQTYDQQTPDQQKPVQQASAQQNTTQTNKTQQQKTQNSPAQIFKVVNEDGSVTYTDTPPPNAETVELDIKTRNVVSAIKTPKTQKVQVKKKKPNYSVSITSPAPEATLRDNAGNIVIKAEQNSAEKAPLYRLIFDGAPVKSNSSGIFKLEGVHRGAHTYKVELTNNTGKTLASSPTQTLYLHQASVFINNN